MELEISAETEMVYAPTESITVSTVPSSTSTTEYTSPSLDDSPTVQTNQGWLGNNVQLSDSSLASSNTDPGKEWLCDFPNCGKSFTERHKVNRHRKYHIKSHLCLEPSCAIRLIAFSLEKDLVKHQAKHNGQRFYCNHPGCSYAPGGAEGGFTRKDNLHRHITKQHWYIESKLKGGRRGCWNGEGDKKDSFGTLAFTGRRVTCEYMECLQRPGVALSLMTRKYACSSSQQENTRKTRIGSPSIRLWKGLEVRGGIFLWVFVVIFVFLFWEGSEYTEILYLNFVLSPCWSFQIEM